MNYRKLLKKAKQDYWFFNTIKEITVDELGELYFNVNHKYLGYSWSEIGIKYLGDSLALWDIPTFDMFVSNFKIRNYRIM